jgi:hypothetical protein
VDLPKDLAERPIDPKHSSAAPCAAVPSYVAHFTPEAWVNDNAVEVDPEGAQEWDCTTFVGERQDYFGRLFADEGGDPSGAGVIDASDTLVYDPAAPEWVRAWSGPFTIRVRRVGVPR